MNKLRTSSATVFSSVGTATSSAGSGLGLGGALASLSSLVGSSEEVAVGGL